MADKKSKKVSIIGAGAVGAGIAYSLMIRGSVDDICLIDVNDTLVNAQVLDIQHGVKGISSANVRQGSYEDIADSDLVIITAGRSRKPEESRIDMVFDNVKIANKIAQEIKKYYTSAYIFVVANPVDILTQKFAQWLKLPKGKVFGSGCILDSSRFVFTLANYFNVKSEDIEGFVIGEHGETQVLLWSSVKIKGLTLEKYCEMNNIDFSDEKKAQIVSEVKGMGAKIIAGKEKTFFGVATCVCQVVEALVHQKSIKTLLSMPLAEEYGIEGVSLSVPCLVDSGDIKPLPLDGLTNLEEEAFIASKNALKNILKKLEDLNFDQI